MSVKRRDNKKRILRNGESQRSDGRYVFKYTDCNGKTHFAYSWKLEKTDKLPSGKRECEALRDMEKYIRQELDKGILPNAGGMTVLQLVEKYVSQKTGVRDNTKSGYRSTISYLKKGNFGQRQISKVKLSDAKEWCIESQNGGLKISTVIKYKGIIKSAFQMAVDDDLILKNPFLFTTSTILVNDRKKKDSLTKEQERIFLDFIKTDEVYSKYYDVIYILLYTGLRISEFCGLTLSDVDLEKRIININHQLLYGTNEKSDSNFYVEKLKTDSGFRTLPISEEVCNCFRNVINSRKKPKTEMTVCGVSEFIYLNKKGKPSREMDWSKCLKRICAKYNKTHTDKLPEITPHTCRHTYCSRMVNKRINPKALQYLMGHSDISTTLNIYTHTHFEEVCEEINRLEQVSQD